MAYSIEQFREIVELAKRKKYDELDELWLQMTEEPTGEMRFYDATARALLKNGAREKMAELFSVMVTALLEKGRPLEALELVRIAWRSAPDLNELHDSAVAALEALHGDRPNFRRFLLAAGLDASSGLIKALQRFEEFLNCDVGEVFEHKTMGFGIVEEIEPDQRKVSIRFPGKPPKDFTFEGVREFLAKHERGSFRSERLRDPEAVKKRAFELGPEFVRFVLKDYPEGLSQIDLKGLFLEGVMSKDEWDKWWAANRRLIQRDPYIDVGRGSRSPMKLRAEPKTYYEGVYEEYADTDTATRLKLVDGVRKHLGEEPAPADFGQRLVEALQSEMESLDAADFAGRLERVFIARDVEAAFPDAKAPAAFDARALLAQAPDPGQAVLNLSTHDLQCRAVEVYTSIDPARAAELCAKILPDASPRFAQWIVDRLMAQGATDRAAIGMEQVLRSPRRNPETFMSVARQFVEGKFAALALEIEPGTIVREMAEYIRDLQNQIDHGVPNTPALRGIKERMKNIIVDDHCELLKQAVAPLPLSEARTLMKVFDSHSAFPDSYHSTLRHTIAAFRPEMEGQSEAERAADIDPTVLYVTPESLRKKRAELQHIRSVEIPKNSKEIGEAASLGDLSENAEYEAARHRQRMLFMRAGELQGDIERARTINPNWVRTDCVWIGTRFRARNLASNEVEMYTILGAWDSDPDRGILSYLTSSAAQFLRKKIGEHVKVQRTDGSPAEYEILEVENAVKEQGGTMNDE